MASRLAERIVPQLDLERLDGVEGLQALPRSLPLTLTLTLTLTLSPILTPNLTLTLSLTYPEPEP